MKKHVRIEHVAWLPAWCNMVKHDIMEKRKFLEKNELTGETVSTVIHLIIKPY